jgi:putative acetyltransferase
MTETRLTVLLRRYEPRDLDALIELVTESVWRVNRGFYTEDQLAAWAPRRPDTERWRTRLRLLSVWLAEHEGELVGVAAWDRRGHLDLLYVAAGHQRRGVARRLCERIEGEARDSDQARLTVYASLGARRALERFGFEAVGMQYVERGGVSIPRWEMVKRIPHKARTIHAG